jgi:methionyl-tRNA formyltransferase
MPPIGTFNLHASLLPQYRGAAPIHWAIIRGETETGVTTFFLRHEIDTGPIVFQEKEPIDELDTAGSLYERLMHKGADLVLKTIEAVETGSYPQWPQPVVEPIQTAPKIFTETCQVDSAQSSRNVYNFIRGLSPFPGAWTRIGGLLCKVYKGTIVQGKSTALPGILDSDQKSYLHISTLDGWIALEEIQREGKKKMKIAEFLRGNRV